jgi:hypothetical protein
MSKSIVFGKWDATPICVFEAKVMRRLAPKHVA